MEETGTTTVESEVPYSRWICVWLQVTPDQSLQTLSQQSALYIQNYLAWELVRKRRNPFFENGTGFEGYFVGICRSPDEALAGILAVGYDILDNLARLYRHEVGLESRLLDTLFSERGDSRSMSLLADEFGARLGQLRCNLYHNGPAELFNRETYSIARWLPPLRYVPNGATIHQCFTLAGRPTQGPKLAVFPGSLKPDEQEAWQVMEAIGKFGHPLLREALRHVRT